MSLSHLGMKRGPQSEEHKRKLSESIKRAWANNPERRKHDRERVKKWWADRKKRSSSSHIMIN